MPDAIYLGGIVCNNGVKLLKDIRAAVGQEGAVRRPGRLDAVLRHRCGAARPPRACYVSYAGLPLEKLPAKGKAFIKAFSKYLHLTKGELPPPYSVYQAQAAQIILAAIAKSNGTRADVTAQAVRLARHERDHGHVPLRQERGHHPDQGDQHGSHQGQDGSACGRGHPQGVS